MTLDIGDVIDDKYEITGLLGEGGMGTVFLGLHRKIHRRVAIKVLKAGIAADENMVRRFEREAQAAGRIGSKHIVEVLDVGQIAAGERYMILEFLDGETLSTRIKRLQTMGPADIFPIVIQLLKGVASAHAAGIVHRDLKPANVFLVPLDDDGGDFVKVLDFGVSKFHFLEGDGVTTTGTIVGTPHYMAPEQTRDAASVDRRCDVYSVGAILYRALSGRTPFLAKTLHELVAKLIADEPARLATIVPGLDPTAAAIVHQALARAPEDRFQSAEHFIEALRAWLEDAGVSFVSGRLSNAGLPAPDPSGPSGPPAAVPSDGQRTVYQSVKTPALTPRPEEADDPTEPMEVPPPPTATAGQASDAGEPTSLATPSPAFYESTLRLSPRRSRVGVVLAGGAVVGVAAIVAIASLGGGETPAVGQETDTTEMVSPGGAATASQPSNPEPQSTASAAVSASASASASATLSARPVTKPKATKRPPKPRTPPPEPPPKPADDRDFRTDL
ncbi:MAG: serine/threonine protein kinase [Deltaproteobacteria bacterium]|nr:serine/threonine protein kinase [Deltaproteobacteria bacterium]